MDFFCLGGGLASTPTSGGMMTDLRRGEGWPAGIPNGRHIVQNHLNRQVVISCGFLREHEIGATLSQKDEQQVRVARSLDDVVVVAQQISSLLMLPRSGIRLIRGDVERDILNDEHLHLHVTAVEYDTGLIEPDVQIRYNQVQLAVAILGSLNLEDLPDGLVDAIEAFLVIWGNPDSVRTGDFRRRLSALEEQLASTYDNYTVDDDIVQFLTGGQSPFFNPPPTQVRTSAPPPLSETATVIPANVPAWLVSEDSIENLLDSTGQGVPSSPRPPRRVLRGRLYLRVVVGVDEDGNPVTIYPVFKHGKFRTRINDRLGQGNTDLPPRDSSGHRLVSEFCVVSGFFQDDFNAEREFSRRLEEAGFEIQQGIGGQSEWHRFNGVTNQERYVELLNAIEVLENYSNESGVISERRNILEQLELHFN